MSIPLAVDMLYTEKQKSILEQLNLVISREGIEIRHNELPKWGVSEIVSVDVEHDECGTFVGCGIYRPVDSRAYYYSDLSILLRIPFSTFSLIGHNGVSDIEMLQWWGINVEYDQLVWDTMLIAHLIDSSKKDFGLKACVKRELGIEYPNYDDIVGKRGLKTERITLDKQPLELAAKYNALDCWTTWKLYELQRKAIGNEAL